MNAKINLLIVCLVLFSIIGQIRFLEEMLYSGEEVEMHINVNNNLDYDLDDTKVRVLIYNNGEIINSNPFSVEEGETKGKFVFWNAPSDDGEYLLRIVTSNDNKREVKHRYIVVG